MHAQDDRSIAPSFKEFRGYYNILDEDGAGGSIPIFRTTENLPPFSFNEMWEVRTAAVKWFEPVVEAYYAGRKPDPLDDELFVRDSTDDRTQRVDVPHLDMVSVELLERLQREFLGRYPLWRVALIGEDISTTILVYPRAVYFGDEPEDIDGEEAIRRLQVKCDALREARKAPETRRVAYLKQRLPQAVQEIGERPFYVVAVVEVKYYDEEDLLAVYVLFPGHDSWAVKAEIPGSRDEIAQWDKYGIDATGAIVSAISIPETVPSFVASWLLPHDYRGPLDLIDTENETRHRYEVKSEDIVTDEQLKMSFQSSFPAE